MGKARREDELTSQLLGDLRVATTPEEIYRAYQRAGKPDVASKMQSERLTQDKLRGELKLQPVALAAAQGKLVEDKFKLSRELLDGVSTPEQYIAWHEANHADPVLGKVLSDRGVTVEQSRARIDAALQQPGGLERLINESKLGVAKFAEMNKPSNVQRNTGNTVETLSIPGMGGAATVVPGSQATIQVSPNTAATIKAARINHLENLAQQGWTFDTERGIGVNARLGLSKPISTLMSQTGGPLAAPVGGAPAVQSGVPMVAPTGVPGQRQAPAGQPVAGPSVLGPKPADTQKTEIELNKQYTSESKGFIETKLAIDKAKAALRDAATNPTAGLSAGTAFMKILDPASVVRETELAMALKSSGWFDRVTNIANTLQSGKTILTPTQITNLNKTIDGLFEEVKAEQRIVDSGYARRAKSYGLDVRNIITDRGQNKVGITEQTPPNAPPIQSFRPSPEGRP